MQAQNAAYAMGQIPHPETGEAPVNLELARLFIDQLIVLRTKTRGNLSQEELGVLNNAISNLQLVFVEVSKGEAGGAQPIEEAAPVEEPVAEAAAPAPEPEPAPAPAPAAEESRKKFSKSYGA